MDINYNKKRLTLSVSELSRLVADTVETRGSVSLSLRGRLGSKAHRSWQEGRKQDTPFRQEVHLDVCLPGVGPEGWEIRVRGRLDGLTEELDRLVVEELKTVALPPSRFASLSADDFPRHRRQVEIYLHLLAHARPDKPAFGKLVYLNLPTNKKRIFEIPYDRAEVERSILDVAATLIEREIRRAEERQQKIQMALQFSFPFPKMRLGQQDMIEAIQEALRAGSSLLLEAPTGLGKTAAALFAALPYALEHDKQVMFLTSKTTQQDLVFRTAQELRLSVRFPTRFACGNDRLDASHSRKDFSPRPESCFPRTLLLRARQKICPMESPDAEMQDCPYREDFFHRLRQSGALLELLNEGDIHPDRVREVGEREHLCPHELQLLLAEEADLIIGDYNYAFDPGARLERLFVSGDPSRLILIVDEAHNLPDRARSYYSPQLTWESVQAAVQKLEARGVQSFDEPVREIQNQFEYYLAQAPVHLDPVPIELSATAWARIGEEFDAAVVPYWYSLSGTQDSEEEDSVLLLHRQLEDFRRILALEGDNFAPLLRRAPAALEILCLDAAPMLAETFSSVHAAICLSATLQPSDAYTRLLGLEKVASLALPSPFPREHLRVIIDASVTTLYREREANIEAIAAKLQLFYQSIHKNILAFFPSFELMRRISSRLKIKNILYQDESLTDAGRADLLARFKKSRHALLCCVMGGVFAEGIDLPGKLAEAAVIVGVGLPLVCTENELRRAYFERSDNQGFEYVYLYPGMRRVIQAAGRIIRAETDTGLVLLLDRRYTQRQYQQLFPQHWYRRNPAELVINNFERVLAMENQSIRRGRHEV
jgi:DNA excision repair protein ERCC-2